MIYYEDLWRYGDKVWEYDWLDDIRENHHPAAKQILRPRQQFRKRGSKLLQQFCQATLFEIWELVFKKPPFFGLKMIQAKVSQKM